MVTEFGAEANRDGPVEEKGTFQFQQDFVNYHLGDLRDEAVAQRRDLLGDRGVPRAAGLGRRQPAARPADPREGPAALRRPPKKPAWFDVHRSYTQTQQIGARAGPVAGARAATLSAAMATNQGTQLALTPRDTSGGSRATRRLRRTGRCRRALRRRGRAGLLQRRRARAAPRARGGGAVLDLQLDGDVDARRAQGRAVPPGPRRDDARRPPPRPASTSRSTRRSPSSSPAPTRRPASEGGVLDQITREVNVEALPNDIPESITFDVSKHGDQRHAHLAALTAPEGVTLLDDLEETRLATLSPPRRRRGRGGEEIEQRPGVVGEGEGDAEAAADAEAAGRRAATPPTSSRRRAVRAAAAPRRSTGSSSGSATPAPSTPGRPTTSASRSRTRSRARWDLPKAKKKYAGLLTEGRAGARRPARRGAAAADVHERGRPLRRPRARRAEVPLDRVLVAARRDRPAVRRHPHARSAAGWPATTA